MITADTITDEQIEQLFDSLPPGHYARQWCLDARFPVNTHPHRHTNARRELAKILNERAKPAFVEPQALPIIPMAYARPIVEAQDEDDEIKPASVPVSDGGS